MRVLQIVKTNEGATWAFKQAKWLHHQGVDIITVLPDVYGGMVELYKQNGMPTIKADFSLPITRPWKIFKKAREIDVLVKQINPDLIHCHFVTNIMMLRLALRKSNIPRIFQVPGPLHLENWIYRKAEIILADKNDYWAGACKKTCEMYRESGTPSDKVYLAYYGGYGGEACDEYTENENKLHHEFGIASNKTLIGMVGYFYKPKTHLLQARGLKGHEDFIDAIALVRQTHPAVVGVIIGDAWGNGQRYVKKIKDYALKKCKAGIIFTGFRTDLKSIYRELDIAVHPSHSENLGGAAESLAAGIPTISTNVGGFPDIVVHGETGYLCAAKDPKDLAEKINKMLDDMRHARIMAHRGQERVARLLDINNTGRAVLDIYKTILRSKN